MVSGPSSSRQVCLTFDDGPGRAYTPRVLDMLRAHAVRATFFLLGKNAAAHPHLVRRIAAEGHAIANHTFSHFPAEQVSARQFFEETVQTRRLLEELVGRPPRLLRPPFGKLTVGKLSHSWRAMHTVVLWNNDPKDFASQSAQQVRDWFDEHPLAGGQIVLLHGYCPYLVKVLPDVIADARRRGLEFTTVDSWVHSPLLQGAQQWTAESSWSHTFFRPSAAPACNARPNS
ncbi:MAG TPA: polysaccharide deacetylase family protein [Pirellulales bacterium]|nr:polysaccharide deacetylase family protein [Pirellulales bacterium]